MTALAVRAPVPPASAITRYLAGADFNDTWAVTVERTGRTSLDLYLHMAARTPAWVNGLMTIRNRVVAACGGKDVGYLSDIDPARPASAYREGDPVGPFSILQLADAEVILVATDKHLDVWMSVCLRPAGAREAVAITTVVHVHNPAGRLYMLFVTPMHCYVVPALLASLSRGLTP